MNQLSYAKGAIEYLPRAVRRKRSYTVSSVWDLDKETIVPSAYTCILRTQTLIFMGNVIKAFDNTVQYVKIPLSERN